MLAQIVAKAGQVRREVLMKMLPVRWIEMYIGFGGFGRRLWPTAGGRATLIDHGWRAAPPP